MTALKIILAIFIGLSAYGSIGLFAAAETIMHEILAALVALSGTMLLVAWVVVEAIQYGCKRMEAHAEAQTLDLRKSILATRK